MVQEIAAGRAPEEIAPRLAARFAGADGQIEREVIAFIAQLRDNGLVEG